MLRAPAAPLVALLGLVCAVSCTELPTIEAAPVDGGGVDAGLDAGGLDAGPVDAGALPDAVAPDAAVEPSGCQVPTVPPRECAAATCTSTLTTRIPFDATTTLLYPHGLAVAGPSLYLALQRNTEAGRTGDDTGAIYRTPRELSANSTKSLEPLTKLMDRPHAVATGFGYVYWATGAAPAADTNIYRLKLLASVCLASNCDPPELVTTISGAVTSLVVLGPDKVVAAADGPIVLTRLPAGQWQDKLLVGQGRLAGVPGGTAFFATPSFLYKIPPGSIQATVVVPAPGGVFDFGVAAECTDVVGYSANTGALYTRSPLTSFVSYPCTGTCPDGPIEGGVLDVGFAYFALPKSGGVFRVSRSNRVGFKLFSGDVTAVAVDNDAVYATERSTGQIVRIAK
jgi:hypothetical protein